MTQPANLTQRETHFEFGQNWQSFLERFDDRRLAASKKCLGRLLPGIKDKTFLDIGSGSGLSSLAALGLG